jgi:hypothetical protein
VTNDLVFENLAREVSNNLVHPHHDATRFIWLEAQRDDMWIDLRPLAQSVGPHFSVAVEVAAFHSVRPDNVEIHRG